MEIQSDTHEVSIPEHASAGVVARAGRVFSRLKAPITRLQVTLKALNGTRSGRDKMCVVRAELADGRQVWVIDRSTKMRRAVTDCLRRAKVLITQEIERRRTNRPALVRGVREPALSATS